MRQIRKQVLLCCILLPLVWGCNKDDDFRSAWACNIEEQNLPAGDTARLFLPNAFSPNGDGLNDIFVPQCVDITNIRFTVYDNEKQILFTTTELNKGWDGLSRSGEQYTICHYSVEGISKSGNRIARCGSAYRLTCYPKGVSWDNFIFGDQFDPTAPDGYLKGVTSEALDICD